MHPVGGSADPDLSLKVEESGDRRSSMIRPNSRIWLRENSSTRSRVVDGAGSDADGGGAAS